MSMSLQGQCLFVREYPQILGSADKEREKKKEETEDNNDVDEKKQRKRQRETTSLNSRD
jgi:hypothetical protein